jgi:hypothetical protein
LLNSAVFSLFICFFINGISNNPSLFIFWLSLAILLNLFYKKIKVKNNER